MTSAKSNLPVRGADRPIVAIVSKSMAHYRVPFYSLLEQQLARFGIALRLYYTIPSDNDYAAAAASTLDWATQVRIRSLRVPGGTLLWQPILRQVMTSQLVIVEQASKLALNYLLIAAQGLGGPRVAYWGHGRNFQAERGDRWVEWTKAKLSTHVHWWFAYNAVSARTVAQLGFPESKITVVNNSVDTKAMRTAAGALSQECLSKAATELSVGGNNICIYSGRMYEEKRIAFLLEAATSIRERIPDFELIIVGTGPDAPLVTQAAAQHRWIHYAGARYGSEALPLFGLSKLILMPGAVGLVLLDSFAYQVPLITTKNALHGPELDYLVDGVNGCIVESGGSPGEFARKVVYLLTHSESLERLRAGCEASAQLYSIEEMAARFASGVTAALHAGRGS